MDLKALRPGRGAEAWPGGKAPDEADRHRRVCFEPDDPRFAQMGEDARTASAERGEAGVSQVVDHLVERIHRHLKG